MASIQHKGFNQSQSQLSLIFKALGHPARIAILELLAKEKRVMCKELVLSTPLSSSSISSHLKILFESGILGYEKEQNVTYYVINPLVLENAKKSLKLLSRQSLEFDYDYSRTYFKMLPEQFV